MPKLSPINSRKLIKILRKEGFVEIRQKGSHLRMEHTDGRKTTVPVHAGESIGIGLLGKIIKDTQVSEDLFRR